MITIRARVDTELTRRIGTWFTVRDIQRKLRINPSTLKPLIMKYARERVLRRRRITGTARSVEFTPAVTNSKAFCNLIVHAMPYREITCRTCRTTSPTRKRTTIKRSPSRTAASARRRRR